MNKTHEHTKVFRAEKTTRNRDDFKVMMVGTMVAILMMLLVPTIKGLYDSHLAERPFIRATVEIIQTDDYERPMLLYDADAIKSVEGIWVAIIRDAKGQRLETRRGDGSYGPQEDNPRLWTWAAFFDDESGGDSPTVPNQPFMVCLRYTSQTIDTGIVDESPEICSKVFYPELLPINETIIGAP